MPKDSAAKVLTGSTGSAAIDMTPRTAFITFVTGTASFGCVVLGADATITALSGTLAASGAVLALAAFDGLIRPRL